LATKELAVASRQRTVFFLFLRVKIKLNGRHFDTIEVIEAESQAVLNALTERDFEDAFKNKRRKRWER
jgi:hypothetical protein